MFLNAKGECLHVYVFLFFLFFFLLWKTWENLCYSQVCEACLVSSSTLPESCHKLFRSQLCLTRGSHRCERSEAKQREREHKRQRERWDRIITPPAALEMVITEHPHYLPIFGCVSKVKWGCTEPGVKDNSPRADAWHRCHPSRRISSRSALALWVTCYKVTFFEQLSLSPVSLCNMCVCLCSPSSSVLSFISASVRRAGGPQQK